MLTINGDRILEELHILRGIGAAGVGRGVRRRALSEADREAREWLRDKMQAAGLEAAIDRVGNVLGRAPGQDRALLIGSHSDTQPEGGWLDGALGVIYGLEIARAFQEAGAPGTLGIDAVSWIDEEGRFGSMLGSRSFCDRLPEDELMAAADRDGVGFVQALKDCGWWNAPPTRWQADRHRGYLEAHIEQGPWLEREELAIGVVSSIVGIRTCTLRFDGQQNHAGTTPMALRRDAGKALIHFAARLDDIFADLAETHSVWTFGDAHFHPGAPSAIPGRAELVVQFRDGAVEVLDRFDAALDRLIAETNDRGPVAITRLGEIYGAVPAAMDATLRGHLEAAAEAMLPGKWRPMPSGAGHDAQQLASRMPAAMLFIPSIGGVSHSFAEDSLDADIVTGCQVMARAVERILEEDGGGPRP